MNEIPLNICNWCGQPSTIIWVHGHGQCSVCGINVDECCRGEESQSSTLSQLVRQSSNKKGREGEKAEND